jgi:hypothetical protein
MARSALWTSGQQQKLSSVHELGDDPLIDAAAGYGLFKGQVYSDRMPLPVMERAVLNNRDLLQPGPAAPPGAESGPGPFDCGFQRNTIGATSKPVSIRRGSPGPITTSRHQRHPSGSARLGTGSGNG